MINSKNGFSLLEVIIAITILLVGVTSAFSLVTLNSNITRLSQNKLIAAMLVQEDIEVVRNRRDNNWLSISEPKPNWDDNLPISEFPFGIFTRTVIITDNPDGNLITEDIKIESKVSWVEGGREQKVSAEDHLFNWK